MEAKNLFVCPIEEISAEALSLLQQSITKELEHRRTRAKETAWVKVVSAIKDYITTFGDIEIYDGDDDITLYLTSLDNFSHNGEIRLNFE